MQTQVDGKKRLIVLEGRTDGAMSILRVSVSLESVGLEDGASKHCI
jgi:hypothetical protein